MEDIATTKTKKCIRNIKSKLDNPDVGTRESGPDNRKYEY